MSEKSRDVWSSEVEQTISIDFGKNSDGIYFVVVKDKSTAGFCKLTLIN